MHLNENIRAPYKEEWLLYSLTMKKTENEKERKEGSGGR